MTKMEQFKAYIDKIKPKQFLRYKHASNQKRSEFQSVINHLQIDLNGIKFLDIGTGYGDTLDICFEKKAAGIEFVEIDNFFFTYNRLKSFTMGYRINHETELHKLTKSKYDLIWVKGAFSADHFINKKDAPIKTSFSNWLIQLEKLASETCQIIICPHWLNADGKRFIEDHQNNSFTKTMINAGYSLLPEISSHNSEPEYPITFYKKLFPVH